MKTFLYSPEGEPGGSGGAAVVDAPNPGGSEPDIGDMSMSDAISSVFKVDPKPAPPKREVKKDPKAEQKAPEKKAEVKPDVKPEVKPEQKRTSIFDTPEAETKPETKPAIPEDVPETKWTADNWKAANESRKRLLQDLSAKEE